LSTLLPAGGGVVGGVVGGVAGGGAGLLGGDGYAGAGEEGDRGRGGDAAGQAVGARSHAEALLETWLRPGQAGPEEIADIDRYL